MKCIREIKGTELSDGQLAANYVRKGRRNPKIVQGWMSCGRAKKKKLDLCRKTKMAATQGHVSVENLVPSYDEYELTRFGISHKLH